MHLIAAALASAAALALAQANDTTAQFPALQTTLADPRTDGGEPLSWCAVIEGERRCGEDLGEAWCRKRDYAGGFVKWTAADAGDIARCVDDDSNCPVVTTITCQGVPISD